MVKEILIEEEGIMTLHKKNILLQRNYNEHSMDAACRYNNGGVMLGIESSYN